MTVKSDFDQGLLSLELQVYGYISTFSIILSKGNNFCDILITCPNKSILFPVIFSLSKSRRQIFVCKFSKHAESNYIIL